MQQTLSSSTTDQEVTTLRNQLERTQAAFVSAVMEKNFFKRAMADFNFHHNAHDGIVYTDDQNRVVYANPYFLKMMEIDDPIEILNKPLPSYMWSTTDDETQLFQDVRENGFVRERELNLYNRNKAPVFVACSSVASKDDVGNFIGTEIMLCNVTTKRKIQAELAQRTQALERVSEFCRSTLENMADAVQRGAERDELMTMLKHMQAELKQTL